MTHAGNLESHFWVLEMHNPGTLAEYERAGYTTTGYYFWDETEAFVVGPHDKLEASEKARAEYEP